MEAWQGGRLLRALPVFVCVRAGVRETRGLHLSALRRPSLLLMSWAATRIPRAGREHKHSIISVEKEKVLNVLAGFTGYSR